MKILIIQFFSICFGVQIQSVYTLNFRREINELHVLTTYLKKIRLSANNKKIKYNTHYFLLKFQKKIQLSKNQALTLNKKPTTDDSSNQHTISSPISRFESKTILTTYKSKLETNEKKILDWLNYSTIIIWSVTRHRYNHF